MELTINTSIPNIFVNEQQIRDQIIGTYNQYPTLTLWESVEREINSWKIFMKSCKDMIDLSRTTCFDEYLVVNEKDNKLIVQDPRQVVISNPDEFNPAYNRVNLKISDNQFRQYDRYIKRYLDPLTKIKYPLNNGHIELICRAWMVMLDDPLSYEWITRMFNENSTPEWIHTCQDYEQCPIKVLIPYLAEWCDRFGGLGNLSFYWMFKIFNLFFTHGTNNFPLLILIKENLEDNIDLLKFTERNLNNNIKELNTSITYQRLLNSGEKTFDDLVMEISDGDFKIFTDEMTQKILNSMKKAIENTPGAEMWFRKNGKLDCDDPMVTTLSKYGDVYDCGHSGSSMTWTFGQFRCIYQKGWRYWVKQVFLAKGIGLNQN